ncbi:hypothetical protein [Bacillus cereus]|uniref:hypothetical protein n=1 Tax=Bacillus cereus TaxID=1396 RepID=UPI0015967ABB|nr:hypothetical protein [Bacillus cereus]
MRRRISKNILLVVERSFYYDGFLNGRKPWLIKDEEDIVTYILYYVKYASLINKNV